MFGFHWLARRQDRKRSLFRYWDGRKWRRIDPARAWREIDNHETVDLATMGPLVDEGKEPATTILIEAFCEVFSVQRYDDSTGDGLTDNDILSLVLQLQDYFNGLKKNTSTGPISPERTASESSQPKEGPG